ncbi:MAG: hypothetical protein ICV87_03160 [Gemmatimonadetes bacterium]|nr:hypothetical protein [Gemmatimonadota bacterium]
MRLRRCRPISMPPQRSAVAPGTSFAARCGRHAVAGAAIAMFGLILPRGAHAQQRPDTAAWFADFAQLKAELAGHYANLTWAVEERGLTLPELSRTTEDALRNAQSEAAARAAIERFLNAFGDGHLEVRWPAGEAAPVAKAQSVCERLGYAPAQRGGGIRFELLPDFRWLPSPDSVPFRAGVLLSDGDTLGILRIPSFEDNIYPALCERAAQTFGVAADGPCDEACGARVEAEAANQLTAVLERRVAMLQAEGITRLLVDLTRNGGGSNWVEAAARTLTPVQLRGARVGFIRHPHYVRAFDARIRSLQRDSAARKGDEALVARALHELRQHRHEAAVPCDRSPLWEGRAVACDLVVTDPARYSTGLLPYAAPGTADTALFTPSRYRYREGAYRGPLIVLVDRGTASAAEYFAALMMDNSAGVVAGEPTFGAGCGYTDGGIPTVLRHSKARVRIPDCVRYRPHGANEVEGIAPDMPIPWRANDTPLQRARRVLDTLGGSR